MVKNIKTRLEETMKERGIKNYAELSRLTGLSKQIISQWVNGKYRPSTDKLLFLARYLEVDPYWLIGEEEEQESEGTAEI